MNKDLVVDFQSIIWFRNLNFAMQWRDNHAILRENDRLVIVSYRFIC